MPTPADRPGHETDRDDAGGTGGVEESGLGVGGVQGAPGKEDELGAERVRIVTFQQIR